MKRLGLILGFALIFFAFFSLEGFWFFNFNSFFSSKKKEKKIEVVLPLKKKVGDKKKILVLSSCGGGGHSATTRALQSYLGPKYCVESVNVFTTILGSMDPINKITIGRYTGEDIYNSLLKNGNSFLASELKNFGAKRAISSSKKIEKLLYNYMVKEQPDMVISVIPIINSPILAAAKRLNIPFLVVTNDLDTSNYANGFTNIDYDKFKYTLAFKEEGMLQKISKASIPENKLATVGFPIREHFFEKKNLNLIKRNLHIPPNKKIIMLMMGATGSSSTLRYAKKLASVDLPLHLIVCTGRNTSMQKKLKKIKLSDNVSMSVLGFIEKVSDLMAVSDILITKPGPNSICEALQMNLPVILDCTKRILYWEKYNVEFVKANGFGDSINCYSDIVPMVKKYLANKSLYEKSKLSISAYNKPFFKDNIRALVDGMFKKA